MRLNFCIPLSLYRYDPNDDGSDSITGWYCNCPSGARNVGACAHVTSTLWYLGYARYLDNLKFPAEKLFDGVLDARDVPAEPVVTIIQNSGSEESSSRESSVRVCAIHFT